MPFKITQRELDGGIFVVTLEGRLVFGEGGHALREQLKSMLAQGRARIVLDMSGLTFIDSSGLATLAAAHQSARQYHGSLKLVGVAPSFREMLWVIGLGAVLEIYDSESAALASFTSS